MDGINFLMTKPSKAQVQRIIIIIGSFVVAKCARAANSPWTEGVLWENIQIEPKQATNQPTNHLNPNCVNPHAAAAVANSKSTRDRN